MSKLLLRFIQQQRPSRTPLLFGLLLGCLSLTSMATTPGHAQTAPEPLPITVQQQKERWWEPLPLQSAPTTLTTPVLADATASAVRRRDDWVRIVVQTFNENDAEIALVENEFTRQPRKLTDNNAADLFPRLNIIGATEVVFASNRNGNVELYRINVDGTNSVRLTTSPFTDTMPVWSPDGQQIAFVSTRTGNADLFVMGRDGGQPAHLHQL